MIDIHAQPSRTAQRWIGRNSFETTRHYNDGNTARNVAHIVREKRGKFVLKIVVTINGESKPAAVQRLKDCTLPPELLAIRPTK